MKGHAGTDTSSLKEHRSILKIKEEMLHITQTRVTNMVHPFTAVHFVLVCQMTFGDYFLFPVIMNRNLQYICFIVLRNEILAESDTRQRSSP